jgi:hypothetical protein
MRKIFIVLAKLIGLLQIYWGLAYAAAITLVFGQISPMAASAGGQFFIQLVGILVSGFLAFGMAWLLLARTEWLADRLGIEADEHPVVLSEVVVLKTGMKLLGAYFLTRAVPAVVRSTLQASSVGLWGGHSLSIWTTMVPSVLQVVLALLLLIRTSYVLRLVARGEVTSGKRIVVGGVVLLALLFVLSRGVGRNLFLRQLEGNTSSVMDTQYESKDSGDANADPGAEPQWFRLSDEERDENGFLSCTNVTTTGEAKAIAMEIKIELPL